MANVSSGGFTFNIASVGGQWSWTVQAQNVQGLGQLYQLVDIATPYGKLTDVAVPLPGDVVTAMAQSLLELQGQLAPSIVLLSGTPTSYSTTVTEGDSAVAVAALGYTNGGAFGSFLSTSSTPDSPWLTVNPPGSTGVGKSQPGTLNIGILPGLMLATSSPYVGHVRIQNSADPTNFVSLAVNVIVIPRPIIQLSVPTVTLTYSISGGLGGAQQVVVTNSGPATSQLNFTASKVQNQSPWMAFTPSNAGPVGSGGTSPVTFSLINSGLPSVPGIYTETVAIASRTASNSPQQVTVQLVVTP